MKQTAVIKWGVLAAVLLLCGLVPLPRHVAEVRIGSKKFTESVILGEMLRLLAANAGLDAVHYREFGGTRIVFTALETGEIDAYPEYTGTVRQEILANERLPDNDAMNHALQSRAVGVSQSLGFSNTYALALTKKRADELKVTKISDLQRLPEIKLALTHEFLDRGDGWPALAKHYDLPQRSVVGVDHDLAYPQLLSGEIDVIDVYSTDAMIHRSDLVVLADDLNFFPRYDAVWLFGLNSAERHPELLAAIDQLEGAISEQAMRELNDLVESRQRSETQAAADFLRAKLGVRIQEHEADDPRACRRTSRFSAAVAAPGYRGGCGLRSILPALSARWPCGIGVRQLIANNSFACTPGIAVARSGGSRATQHWRRIDHGGRCIVRVLPVTDRAEHLHRLRKHPTRDRRVGNSLRPESSVEIGADRTPHVAADNVGWHPYGRSTKRRVCDTGRNYRCRRTWATHLARYSA
jgi:glycine betaine/choline ABC-type transport system substrate-binding protein